MSSLGNYGKASFFPSTRLIMSILVCWAFISAQMMRANMGMAFVCMLKSTNDNQSTAENNCPADTAKNETEGYFDWTKIEQAHIFAALFLGMVIATFPSGLLCDRFGAKYPLLIGISISAIATILVPVAADVGYGLVTGLRFIMGLTQGVTYSALGTIAGSWIPVNEKPIYMAITTAGNQIGVIITMPMAAKLCASNKWQGIFYLSGGLAGVWAIIWLLLASNSPAKSRIISLDERNFLEKKLADSSKKPSITDFPVKNVLKSLPIYALLLSNFAYSIVVNLMVMYLPLYYKDVLNFDINSNGVYSMLPFAIQWIFKYVVAFLTRIFAEKTKLGATVSCRICNGITFYGVAVCIIAMTFVDCQHRIITVVLLNIAYIFAAFMSSGFMISMIAVAPKFSGSITALGTTMLSLFGFISPYFVAAVVRKGTKQEWEIVFYTAAAIAIAAATLFAFFGSAEAEPWGKIEKIPDSNDRSNQVMQMDQNISTERY